MRKKRDTNDMATLTGNVILDALNRIFRKVQADGWHDDAKAFLVHDVEIVSSRFGVSADAAVLLAFVVENSSVRFGLRDDFTDYLGCNHIEFISYSGVTRELEQKGIVCPDMNITPEAKKAVQEDTEFVPLATKELSIEQLSANFDRIGGCSDDVDVDGFLERITAIVSDNLHLPVCKYISTCLGIRQLSNLEKAMFCYLCAKYFCKGIDGADFSDFPGMRSDSGKGILTNSLLRKESALQKKGLIRIIEDDSCVGIDAVVLTKKAKNHILPALMESKQDYKHGGECELVSCKDIQAKELFYNPMEEAQLNRLGKLLGRDEFNKVQERLKQSGMRHGFNAVLYGVPGTGKTAFVYEIARRTGRDILVADVSKIFDKYVGESEKKVKKVFDDYRRLCHTCDVAPILLLNEADGLLSNRLVKVSQNSDHMLNSMQTIILQEMETIEGILIATTNIVSSFDAAFERRFLFKIEMHAPELETRAKIWHSMMPELSDKDVATLAEKYSFCGGNIENVVRKNTLEFVLSGNNADLGTLVAFCDEEMYTKTEKRTAIGF